MNQKLIAVGLVALVLIAGAWILAGDALGGDGDADVTATIYIANSDNGNVGTSEIDLDDPSMQEQMMLSFGGIRGNTLESYSDSVPLLSKTSHYSVWVDITCRVDSVDGVEIADIVDETSYAMISGKPGPNYLGLDHVEQKTPERGWLTTDDGVRKPQLDPTSGWKPGLNTIGGANDAFTRWSDPDTGEGSTIPGTAIDGTEIHVRVDVGVRDADGNSAHVSTSATLTISVDSWLEDSVSVEITAIGVSTA